MINTKWRFPLLDDGPEQGFNNGGIATFKGADLYDNLAREICQNSLDAKRVDQRSVKVKFEMKSFNIDDYNALKDLRETFKACDEYWKEKKDSRLESFLLDANNVLSNDILDCLVISDYNTTGLTGAKLDVHEKSVWRALTHSDGVTNKGSGSAGSYGIGKNAPFACSSLRTVFYNTYAEDGVKAFQGVSRLVTHKNSEGNYTQGVGFYQNVLENKRTPIFENDICAFRDQFIRDEFGTDVIVIGLNKVSTWEDDIEKAILNNFFVSIYKGLLEVQIASRIIDKQTLFSRIQYFVDKNPEDERLRDTKNFYETLTSEDAGRFQTSILEDDDVELSIRKDDSYNKKIVEMRSIGMIVRIRTKNLLTKYTAVLIVKGKELNSILKNIEPPKHDKWDPDIIDNDEEFRKKAKSIKAKIIGWVNEKINEYCKTESAQEIDPEGVSEYLAFDECSFDDGSKMDDGNNTLEPASIVDKIKQKVSIINRVAVQGLKEAGDDSKEEDINNNDTRGDVGVKSSGGVSKNDGNADVVTPNNGSKTLYDEAKTMTIQKTIPISISNGLYKIILQPAKNYEKLNVELKAIGDDSKKESIPIVKYTLNNVTTNCKNQESFVLTNLEGDKTYEIFVTLKYKERMVIDVQVR